MEETYEYGDARDEVLACRPGITGWWAATDRNDSTWESGQRQARELSRGAGRFNYTEGHYAEALEGKARYSDSDIEEAARENLRLLDGMGGLDG